MRACRLLKVRLYDSHRPSVTAGKRGAVRARIARYGMTEADYLSEELCHDNQGKRLNKLRLLFEKLC